MRGSQDPARFDAAQQYLENFTIQCAKRYSELLGILSGQNPHLNAMALAPADLDPIKLWTIGALTKIVESPTMLTTAEKFQFKNDFLNWLISNYTCLEQKFFMKKMSLLFASLFAQLGSSSKV